VLGHHAAAASWATLCGCAESSKDKCHFMTTADFVAPESVGGSSPSCITGGKDVVYGIDLSIAPAKKAPVAASGSGSKTVHGLNCLCGWCRTPASVTGNVIAQTRSGAGLTLQMSETRARHSRTRHRRSGNHDGVNLLFGVGNQIAEVCS
jgi:hypothetical protein